jgi:hypothetical protein
MSGIIGVSPDMRSGVVGAFPAGHVIQTVSNAELDELGVANATSFQTVVTTVITPKKANSKILVRASLPNLWQSSGTEHIKMRLTRGGSAIGVSEMYMTSRSYNSDTWDISATTMEYLDSPASTSALTYDVDIKTGNVAQVYWPNSTSLVTLTLEEIAQ